MSNYATENEAVEAAKLAVEKAHQLHPMNFYGRNPGAVFAVVYRDERDDRETFGMWDFRETEGFGDLHPPTTAAWGVVNQAGEYEPLEEPRRHRNNGGIALSRS